MKLKVLGSSSSGNCYILDNGQEALIIEAGINFTQIKKALGFNIRKVVGCLITHQHNDHAKYIKAMVENGIKTLALDAVWESKGFRDICSVTIQPNTGYNFGNFKVIPFPACHDVPCVGYLIDHKETGRIMFLTDSCMCEYRFSELNHIMIECNYSDVALGRAIREGKTMAWQRERLTKSHMELNACKGYLRETDISKVTNIILLHLSDHNSDETRFQSEIAGATGKLVSIARPGLEIDMDRLD